MTRTLEQARLWTIAVVCGLVAVSCAGQGPTSPSAAPSPAFDRAGQGVQANTGGAIQLNFSVVLTVPAYPTCPLAPPSAGVLTGTGVLTVVVRPFTDASGGSHIGASIHGHGTLVDENGDTWVWSDADLNNEAVGLPTGNTSANTFSETRREGFHVIGPKGQKILAVGTFHITRVNGTTVVEVETGDHEANEACESGFVLTLLP